MVRTHIFYIFLHSIFVKNKKCLRQFIKQVHWHLSKNRTSLSPLCVRNTQMFGLYRCLFTKISCTCIVILFIVWFMQDFVLFRNLLKQVSLYTRIFIVHCIFKGVCNLTNTEYTVIFFKHSISLSQCFNTLKKFHLCRLYHHFIRDCRGHDHMVVGFMW